MSKLYKNNELFFDEIYDIFDRLNKLKYNYE